MATLTLNVSASTKSWVEDQVEAGFYNFAEALFEDMVHHHQNNVPQMSLEELQEKLRRSKESGISPRSLDDIFQAALQRYQERQARRG